jgi:hypothetical protein
MALIKIERVTFGAIPLLWPKAFGAGVTNVFHVECGSLPVAG